MGLSWHLSAEGSSNARIKLQQENNDRYLNMVLRDLVKGLEPGGGVRFGLQKQIPTNRLFYLISTQKVH